MIVLGAASLLLGALLGGRFKALVLCPATLAVVLAGAVQAHLDGSGFGATLGAIVCLVVLLQAGYAAGLTYRCFGMASLRAKSQRSSI